MKDSAVILVWDTVPNECRRPSALKNVIFTPAILWVESTIAEIGCESFVVHGGQKTDKALLPPHAKLTTTGETIDWLEKTGQDNVLVLGADAPLIRPEEILESKKKHQTSGRKITLFADGDRYITGAGWYNSEAFRELVKIFKEEFTLSELHDEIKEVGFSAVSHIVETSSITPVNSSMNLNKISTIAKQRTIEKHLSNGVEIPINDGIMIAPDVMIGEGTTILPATIIKGGSTIGEDCEIGPNSVVDQSTIGNSTKIISSYIEQGEIGNDTNIGPMSRIRPNTKIGSKIKIGNFVEVKNSTIGDETAISHLTYVGDSDVGKSCNIGCGVVTVNYNGKDKNRTTLGNNVFVGCNCNLVAPVTLEDGAYAACGTTITENVSEDSMVIGRVRQTVKENWAKEKGMFRKG